MKKNNLLIYLAVAMLTAAVLCASVLLFKIRQKENSGNEFYTLAQISGNVIPENPGTQSDEDNLKLSENRSVCHKDYRPVYEKNNDFAGWIRIENTGINYPVMQTPNNSDYYLNHGFDREYSDFGVPYIDGKCVIGKSNNLIVYGHNMNDGSMFGNLCSYSDYEYFKTHRYIYFDTMEESKKYVIVASFICDLDTEVFAYNQYTDMNRNEFETFKSEIENRQLYNTNEGIEYGDELLTLSTCEYSHRNGRFVVVAKEVD